MTARRYFDETGLRGTVEGDGKVDLSNGELDGSSVRESRQKCIDGGQYDDKRRNA